MKRSSGGQAYYMISVVAQKYDIHPQTLRLYEREGLLKPSRTEGNTRLYSEQDLEQHERHDQSERRDPGALESPGPRSVAPPASL